MEICLLQNQHQTEKLHARRSLTARRRACALALGALLAAPALYARRARRRPDQHPGRQWRPPVSPATAPRVKAIPPPVSRDWPAWAPSTWPNSWTPWPMADVSPIMKATAQALDPAQRQAVAAYYASLCPRLWMDSAAIVRWLRALPTLAPGWPPEAPGDRMSRLQPMPWSGGIGVGDNFPALAGQSAAHTFPAVARLAPGPAPCPARWA